MDYLYNASGNLRKDGSKNLHIDYFKTLNLPAELDFGNDNRIFYHYTASGTKLVKHVVSANGNESYTHYIGNIVYEGGALSYILTDEGRLIPEGSGADRRFRYAKAGGLDHFQPDSITLSHMIMHQLINSNLTWSSVSAGK